MNMCPCGSEKSFAKCCEPYITGKKLAASAEILMRARYTAHTQVNLDFIVATHLPETREEIDLTATEGWAKNCDWLGLEILNTKQGKKGDSSGTVEFIAQYREQGERKQHHELSEFEFKDDRWFFKDHHLPTAATPIRVENKVGRNDPCPCGSGKKSKKCCDKAA